MRVIVDTHLFVYREYEKALPKDFQKLLAIFNKFEIKIFAHPFSLQEIERDANLKNPQVILSKVKTYPVIDNPPDANTDDEFLNIVGVPENPRDDTDNQLLYCVYKNAENYLITEDKDIHRKSQELIISNRVLGVSNAIEFFSKQNEKNKIANGYHSQPTFCFFISGDYWIIGEPPKPSPLKSLNGYQIIHFLLQNPAKQFPPVVVYHQNNRPNIDDKTIQDFEILLNDSGIKKLDSNEIEERRVRIAEYQEKLSAGDFENSEDAVIYEQEINRLNSEIYRKVERDTKSIHEKSRTNVTRSIKRSLDKIHYHIPSLRKYLNDITIKTGDLIYYQPIPNDELLWILKEEDLPIG